MQAASLQNPRLRPLSRTTSPIPSCEHAMIVRALGPICVSFRDNGLPLLMVDPTTGQGTRYDSLGHKK